MKRPQFHRERTDRGNASEGEAHGKGRAARCGAAWKSGRLSVGAPPDFQALRIFDELIAEVRVGDRDNRFGPFPSRKALEADLTVFGDKVMEVGAGVGDVCLKGLSTWERAEAKGP